MIKVVHRFRRRASLPADEFAAYWKDVHGPMDVRLPGLRRLVQSHPLAVPGEPRPADDGMTELWFDDLESLAAARKSPEWAAALADEPSFLEPGSKTTIVSAEHELPVPGTTSGWPRLVVLGVLTNDAGELLLCRMPPPRPFAGSWALPGGGVEPGEGVEDALRREAREELGLAVADIVPRFFVEGRHEKLLPDGSRIQRHMVFLVFGARTVGTAVRLNAEFDACAWVAPDALPGYRLNPATKATLERLGHPTG